MKLCSQSPLTLARKAHGLSTRQLALAVKSNSGHISRIETGRGKASPELAKRVADYFNGGISLEEILYPELHMPKKQPASAPRKKPVRRATQGSEAAHG